MKKEAKVIIVKPDISKEESEENFKKVLEILEKIAQEVNGEQRS